jgi:tetratricopeptide (TPR) repeat protein
VNAKLALANFLLAAGRTPEAEASNKEALAKEPQHLLANRMLGVLYIATRQIKEAEQPLKVVADISKAPAARFQLADYYIGAGRTKEAVSLLTSLSSDQGTFAEAEQRLASLDYAEGRVAEAHKRLDAVLTRAPNHAQALVLKARWLTAENKLDEAVAAYDAVVAMQPDGPVEESQRQEAVLGKARVMIIQKNFDDALKLLKEVIAKAADDDNRVNAEAFLRQGDCLREQGNDADAVLSYLLVDVLFSSEKVLHAEALYRLAILWEKIGYKVRADEARERLKSEYENSEWAKQLKSPVTN